MKKILLLHFFLLTLSSFVSLKAQEHSAWKTLAKVHFETRKIDNYQIDIPVFGKELKALDGKIITIKGYILPMELSNKNKFILSSLPYSSCYFCGGAGPETVIEVTALSPIAFSSKPITIKGKLKLNDSDYNQLMYIMTDAIKIE